MTLTKAERLALANLLSCGSRLSNIAFNVAQRGLAEFSKTCEEQYTAWDEAHKAAVPAIRKLGLPPF